MNCNMGIMSKFNTLGMRTNSYPMFRQGSCCGSRKDDVLRPWFCCSQCVCCATVFSFSLIYFKIIEKYQVIRYASTLYFIPLPWCGKSGSRNFLGEKWIACMQTINVITSLASMLFCSCIAFSCPKIRETTNKREFQVHFIFKFSIECFPVKVRFLMLHLISSKN